MLLQCRNKSLDLSRPQIMGIVNCTPDSFSDGGQWLDPERALLHAQALIQDGASMLDIGGESTRPGADPVGVDEEIRRVVPVIEGLRDSSVIVSIDTRHTEVMQAALEAGADLVNDIQALSATGAARLVAQYGAGACLMHMQGQPSTMQREPDYCHVLQDVRTYLSERVKTVCAAGINKNQLLVDPGIGFGKNLQHNLMLLKHLSEIVGDGIPLLIGVSRKSMLGALTGREVLQREYAGIAAQLFALQAGASVFRVHNVAAMRDALTVWQSIEGVA